MKMFSFFFGGGCLAAYFSRTTHHGKSIMSALHLAAVSFNENVRRCDKARSDSE